MRTHRRPLSSSLRSFGIPLGLALGAGLLGGCFILGDGKVFIFTPFGDIVQVDGPPSAGGSRAIRGVGGSMFNSGEADPACQSFLEAKEGFKAACGRGGERFGIFVDYDQGASPALASGDDDVALLLTDTDRLSGVSTAGAADLSAADILGFLMVTDPLLSGPSDLRTAEVEAAIAEGVAPGEYQILAAVGVKDGDDVDEDTVGSWEVFDLKVIE